MSYEEQEYINELTRPARERYCRRQWMTHAAIQWGGWLIAGMLMAIQFATVVH